MKILVLCDRYPFPLTNGQNLRIFHYVRALRAKHSFDLVCYAGDPAPKAVRELFGSINTFPRPARRPSAGLRRLVDAFDVEQFLPDSEDTRQWLRECLGRQHYDLIWVSGWDMIVNLPVEVRVPVLADAVDDGVLEWWRRLRQARGVVGRLRAFKWLLMNARFERRYFGAAKAVLFVSELDAQVFRRVSPGTPSFVVRNGVDTEYFRPLGTPRQPEALVFEGNMSFEPNVEAAAYFVSKVLPLVRRTRRVKLTLVGARPAPEVEALAGPDVEVTGFVEDVRPYIDRAAVFVCPMLSGAGIKNKILQAWAMGIPVIGTTAATGGLEAKEGHNILLGDTPEAFAGAILRVLDDQALAHRLGLAGRQTALDHYAWTGKAQELEAVFERVARVATLVANLGCSTHA